MKDIKLAALKIVLLVFAVELLNMFILDYAALPHLLGALLDGLTIAIAALFIMRRYSAILSRTQAKFSDFAAQVPDSVVITSSDGKITYINPAFERTAGYTLHEAVGKSPNILKSGKHEASFYRDIWQTLKNGNPWRGRIINKKKDGALYTADTIIFPVIDAEGKPVEFVGIWKDITDKLLAEEKLRKQLQTSKVLNKILKLPLENKTLAEILQSALDEILSVEWFSIEAKGAIFLADEKTNSLKLVACAGLGECGKSCAEVPAGRCLCGRVLASGKPVFKAHIDGDHETGYEGMPDHGHYVIPVASGARIYGVINVYTAPGHVRSETDIGFLTAIADILASAIHRKKTEGYVFFLKELQAKAAGIQDSKAALKLLVADICEITGWPVGEVWLPDINKRYLYQASYYHAAGHKTGTFAEQSGNFTFKKGEGFPGRAWESKKPAWAPDVTKDANFPRGNIAVSCGIKAGIAIPMIVDGEVAAVLDFFTTEPKPEDAELMNFIIASAGQLSGILRHNLLSEQLVQSQKMDAVGKLAGGIAHDFNNILGAILGYTDFLIKDLENMPRQAADALEVKKAAERAAALTRQLLTFSRKGKAERRIVNQDDIVKGLLLMLGRITGENIKLEFLHAENASRIKIDPAHLEQVIINLVVNARDAMPAGGSITIETGDTNFTAATAPVGLVEGKYAVLSVSDTGTGMSEEVKRRIFEPFFSTKPEGKGTGLGLSIVYGVIKQNNARITVDSVLGKGTTFTVYIPAVEERETSASSGSQGQGAGLTGTETVLIAEDDDMFRAVLLRVLREHGYTTLAASNAAEALSLANAHTGELHLLLTDIRMPGRNGAELAEELLKSRPGVRVLYMTGYPDADVLDLHHIDDAALLRKPIESRRLLAKVREILNKRANGK